MEEATLQTPLGIAHIYGNESGISEITVTDGHLQEKQTSQLVTLQTCVAELKAYFEGRLRTFSVPLFPQGTAFQKKVWTALCEIPYGTTISYATLARQLGDIKAIRAVAAANGKNPLWVVIPCHRVIGSDGSMTGYASGIWRKEWLLEHEGAINQLSLF